MFVCGVRAILSMHSHLFLFFADPESKNLSILGFPCGCVYAYINQNTWYWNQSFGVLPSFSNTIEMVTVLML